MHLKEASTGTEQKGMALELVADLQSFITTLQPQQAGLPLSKQPLLLKVDGLHVRGCLGQELPRSACFMLLCCVPAREMFGRVRPRHQDWLPAFCSKSFASRVYLRLSASPLAVPRGSMSSENACWKSPCRARLGMNGCAMKNICMTAASKQRMT